MKLSNKTFTGAPARMVPVMMVDPEQRKVRVQLNDSYMSLVSQNMAAMRERALDVSGLSVGDNNDAPPPQLMPQSETIDITKMSDLVEEAIIPLQSLNQLQWQNAFTRSIPEVINFMRQFTDNQPVLSALSDRVQPLVEVLNNNLQHQNLGMHQRREILRFLHEINRIAPQQRNKMVVSNFANDDVVPASREDSIQPPSAISRPPDFSFLDTPFRAQPREPARDPVFPDQDAPLNTIKRKEEFRVAPEKIRNEYKLIVSRLYNLLNKDDYAARQDLEGFDRYIKKFIDSSPDAKQYEFDLTSLYRLVRFSQWCAYIENSKSKLSVEQLDAVKKQFEEDLNSLIDLYKNNTTKFPIADVKGFAEDFLRNIDFEIERQTPKQQPKNEDRYEGQIVPSNREPAVSPMREEATQGFLMDKASPEPRRPDEPTFADDVKEEGETEIKSLKDQVNLLELWKDSLPEVLRMWKEQQDNKQLPADIEYQVQVIVKKIKEVLQETRLPLNEAIRNNIYPKDIKKNLVEPLEKITEDFEAFIQKYKGSVSTFGRVWTKGKTLMSSTKTIDDILNTASTGEGAEVGREFVEKIETAAKSLSFLGGIVVMATMRGKLAAAGGKVAALLTPAALPVAQSVAEAAAPVATAVAAPVAVAAQGQALNFVSNALTNGAPLAISTVTCMGVATNQAITHLFTPKTPINIAVDAVASHVGATIQKQAVEQMIKTASDTFAITMKQQAEELMKKMAKEAAEGLMATALSLTNDFKEYCTDIFWEVAKYTGVGVLGFTVLIGFILYKYYTRRTSVKLGSDFDNTIKELNEFLKKNKNAQTRSNVGVERNIIDNTDERLGHMVGELNERIENRLTEHMAQLGEDQAQYIEDHANALGIEKEVREVSQKASRSRKTSVMPSASAAPIAPSEAPAPAAPAAAAEVKADEEGNNMNSLGISPEVAGIIATHLSSTAKTTKQGILDMLLSNKYIVAPYGVSYISPDTKDKTEKKYENILKYLTTGKLKTNAISEMRTLLTVNNMFPLFNTSDDEQIRNRFAEFIGVDLGKVSHHINPKLAHVEPVPVAVAIPPKDNAKEPAAAEGEVFTENAIKTISENLGSTPKEKEDIAKKMTQNDVICIPPDARPDDMDDYEGIGAGTKAKLQKPFEYVIKFCGGRKGFTNLAEARSSLRTMLLNKPAVFPLLNDEENTTIKHKFAVILGYDLTAEKAVIGAGKQKHKDISDTEAVKFLLSA